MTTHLDPVLGSVASMRLPYCWGTVASHQTFVADAHGIRQGAVHVSVYAVSHHGMVAELDSEHAHAIVDTTPPSLDGLLSIVDATRASANAAQVPRVDEEGTTFLDTVEAMTCSWDGVLDAAPSTTAHNATAPTAGLASLVACLALEQDSDSDPCGVASHRLAGTPASLGASNEHTFYLAEDMPGARLQCTLIATDAAGNQAVFRGGVALVDSTGPVPPSGVVQVLGSRAAGAVVYQNTTQSISVRWEGEFVDIESGVVRVELQLVNANTDEVLINWVALPSTSDHNASLFSERLSSGGHYKVYIRALNRGTVCHACFHVRSA